MSTSKTMKTTLSPEDIVSLDQFKRYLACRRIFTPGEMDWLIMMSINDPAENEDYARHSARMLCSKEEQKQVENLLTEISTNYVRISEILAKS